MNIFYIKKTDSEFAPFKLKFEFETIKDYDTFMGILHDAELRIASSQGNIINGEHYDLISHIKDVINLKIEK